MTNRIPAVRLRGLLLAGGLAVAVAAAGMADAGQRDARQAARDADRAAKALADHDAAGAIALAEEAVSISPREPGYRLVLGQSYLAAGRFASARSALQDAMTLAPANGKVALNLALAAIATGDWHAAQQVLASHRATILPTDLGLATALAGDPTGGVAILTAAVRSPDATVKTRQNLALALALAGRWDMARIVAATDLSPADVDERMQQWTVFAQSHAASDQVAALLGVEPIADPGQPVALALSAPVAMTPAVATPAVMAAPALPVAVPAAPVTAAPPAPAIVAPISSAPAAPVAAPVIPISAPVAAVRAAPAPTAPAAGAAAGFTHVVFGPPSPVVQPLPVATIQPASGPARIAITGPSSTSGRWYVQLGAFASASSAQSAWTRLGHRMSGLAGYEPHGAPVSTSKGSLYRLSVGGFDRGSADQFCHRYRSSGGVCFVRAGAGDQLASWVNRRTQLASR